MGFFSKLFGEDNEAAKALDKLKGLVEAAEDQMAHKSTGKDVMDTLGGQAKGANPREEAPRGQEISAPSQAVFSADQGLPYGQGFSSRETWGGSAEAQNVVAPGYSIPGGPGYYGIKNAPYGVSWGPEMPKEENQYNFRGSYDKYFRTVFREAFPEYDIVEEEGNNVHPSRSFTFWKDGRKALVVELLSCHSNVVKLRNACRWEGTPYLRYYYDYDGWWNTKKYVVNRTRDAMRS